MSESPLATANRAETRDGALLGCEHERATLARTGKPAGLLFEEPRPLRSDSPGAPMTL